ncbi:putative transmembrane protein [Toxoplasma gondii MAS]|uniref:Putative transmembrane protein n=3 Tax=Toxoplasma gondii TaxID=5811 RepID=A0A086Q617_TOXGO|nr:putative transmembrane protein [Toxoplasma gondii MAS]PUA85725.1 putative transmembrane protein [Toxoplasma gondii TgCATBr9]RQX72907.1 putative transmembrane protein [Toxoplasma gondii CAST]
MPSGGFGCEKARNVAVLRHGKDARNKGFSRAKVLVFLFSNFSVFLGRLVSLGFFRRTLFSTSAFPFLAIFWNFRVVLSKALASLLSPLCLGFSSWNSTRKSKEGKKNEASTVVSFVVHGCSRHLLISTDFQRLEIDKSSAQGRYSHICIRTGSC